MDALTAHLIPINLIGNIDLDINQVRIIEELHRRIIKNRRLKDQSKDQVNGKIALKTV